METRMGAKAVSAGTGSSGLRHRNPKSSHPCRSSLILPADADGVSEIGVSAQATASGQASVAEKAPELEYVGQKFNEIAERPQHHDYAQKQCLGDISHELKAPISRIRVLLERARRSPQNVRSYLARIEENVLRMEALTKSLLDFSRLELIEDSLAKEPCDLAHLIWRVVEDARIEAEARGCTIKYATVPECPAFVNYELLHRALENVVRNSVQYTSKNSSISVILSCPANRVAQVVVEDEGPGIPEEELEDVFKPFHSTGHARDNGTFGAGLGLAISERALKLHGGRIKASNRSEGNGLQVTIQIPLLNNPQTNRGPTQAPHQEAKDDSWSVVPLSSRKKCPD